MEKLWTTKSCRSRWKLQFSCKVYLHPSSNKKITNFWKQTGPLLPCPTVVGRCYSAARLLTQWGTVVGPCRRPPRRQMYSFTKFFADHIFLQKRGKKNEKKRKISKCSFVLESYAWFAKSFEARMDTWEKQVVLPFQCHNKYWESILRWSVAKESTVAA
jgi:hypothetical protein